MFNFVLFFLFSFQVLAGASSGSSQEKFFQSLVTEQMKVLAEHEDGDESTDLYPWWARPFLSRALAYRVDESKDASSEKCNSEIWKQRQAAGQGFQKFSESLQKYLNECEFEIKTGWDDPFSNTYKTMMSQAEFDPKNYPRGRFVFFHLNGVKLKGFLALKDDQKPRPMVILRLGIFSNSSEFLPERYLFRQLFEQSDFNMLILESNSGQEFLHRNHALAIGGFDEGIQNFQVARLIQERSQPLSRLVSKVHLLGVSFGGHGVLYSALLNDLNRKPKSKPVIASVLTMCPLVNYRDTLDVHLSQGVLRWFVEYWAKHRMKMSEAVLPGFDSERILSSLVDRADQKYLGPKSWARDVVLPSFTREEEIRYWKANDFWKFYRGIQTPVLIFATEKDPLVLYDLNSKRLKNGYIPLENSQLKVISFSRGYHCSFPGSYMWQPMKNMVEQYYLSF